VELQKSSSNKIFATGGHLGRDKTLEKISSRFYWRPNMTDDVKDFVSKCERCQRTNDKFTKPGSVLHPIPIEPEVWKQVNLHNCIIYSFDP
jgi:hypothetical protein